jgi:hypothetical protein
MRSAGFVGVAVWQLLGLAAVVVGIPLCLGLGLVWWTTRRRDTGRARTARLIGLGVGALVGLAMVFSAEAFLGPIAVVAGYLVGMHYGDPRDLPAGSVRVPRPRRGYVPRWAMLLAIGAAVLTLLAPAILAPIPTATYGRWHPFADDPRFTLPGATLRWPSILDWLPLAVVAAGTLVAGALLVNHVLRLPVGTEPDRRAAIRTITGVVTGIELIALAAQVLFTSAGVGVPAQVGGVAYVVSRILVWSGLGVAAAGIGVWLALSMRHGGPPAGNEPAGH